MTIVVRSEGRGHDGWIDNKRTGENAGRWRRAVNVSQKNLAEAGMGIRQSFYSALELGHRNWTPALVDKFETAILPLLKQKHVDVASL